MARPPDDTFEVPARHDQTSPLSVKLSPFCVFIESQRVRFTDGGLSLLAGSDPETVPDQFAIVSPEPQLRNELACKYSDGICLRG
jgi:hypothetical protein